MNDIEMKPNELVLNEVNNFSGNKCPLEIMSKMYLNSEFADVFIICKSADGNGIQRIPAHKSILMLSSRVFEAMFSGLYKENREVVIDDTFAESMKEFLQFLYLAEGTIRMENVFEIMNLAEKYEINWCMKYCTTFLQQNLTIDNVCQSYASAILFKNAELKVSCDDLIVLNTENVLQTSDFLDCKLDVIEAILERNWITCKESTLLKAIVRWAENVCRQNELTINSKNLRNELSTILHKIRFRSIDLIDFSDFIGKYPDFFSQQETNEIIHLMGSSDYESNVLNSQSRCILESRDTSWSPTSVIVPNQRSWELNQLNVKSVIFITSKPLLLKEIHYGPIHHRDMINDPIPVKIDIFEYTLVEVKRLVSTNIVDFFVMSNENIASLTIPILIKPQMKYEIIDSCEFENDIMFSEIHCQNEYLLDNDANIQFITPNKNITELAFTY